MKRKINIPFDKTYNLPKRLSYINIDNKVLVIAPQTAKWLVLQSQSQQDLFELLKTHSIGHALTLFHGDTSDATYVIKQIEISKIETQEVQSCISNGVKRLQFYLTNECNLQCPHCYMFAGLRQKGELTTDEIKKALADYKDIGGNAVTFSGGEVTMRKDFLTILKYAYSVGLTSRILTNGVLWTESLITESAPLIDSVQISIDGYSEESNSRIRGKGNFDRAKRCIDLFLRLSSNVKVEMSITPFFDELLKQEIPLYVNFLRETIKLFSSDRFKINIAKQIIDGREIRMNADRQREYFDLINQIYAQLYGQDVSVIDFINAFDNGIIMDNCMYGVFSIAANGDVFFCSRVSSLKPAGNIRTMTFRRIEELSRIAEQKSNVKNLSPCNQCDLMYICGGGCRVDYFPELTNTADIEKLNVEDVSPRKCTKEYKLYYYNVMLKANELMSK